MVHSYDLWGSEGGLIEKRKKEQMRSAKGNLHEEIQVMTNTMDLARVLR
jgi:hypothetical protein